MRLNYNFEFVLFHGLRTTVRLNYFSQFWLSSITHFINLNQIFDFNVRGAANHNRTWVQFELIFITFSIFINFYKIWDFGTVNVKPKVRFGAMSYFPIFCHLLLFYLSSWGPPIAIELEFVIYRVKCCYSLTWPIERVAPSPIWRVSTSSRSIGGRTTERRRRTWLEPGEILDSPENNMCTSVSCDLALLIYNSYSLKIQWHYLKTTLCTCMGKVKKKSAFQAEKCPRPWFTAPKWQKITKTKNSVR